MSLETKNKEILHFPKGFLWGSATAAHQIEGNNTNSNWWQWEHSQKRENALKSQGKNPADFYSGIACDSYNRFEEDFALAKQLNQNAHRLSVEWARIQPREGFFNESELDHYEEVLKSAKKNGLKTFVTLHHFTNPIWFSEKGGFEKKENVQFFVEYCLKVTKRLKDYVDFWITFNEPENYSSISYNYGIWPPQKKSFVLMLKVVKNIIKAHNLTALEIKKNNIGPVGIAYHLSDLKPTNWLTKIIAHVVYEMNDKYIFNRTIKSCDFIGLNYYFHHHFGFFGKRKKSKSGHEVNDLGWGIHPEGIERVLLGLKKYNKSIYITENGLADAKDTKRAKFILNHLFYIHKAIEAGIMVKGYLHWSLLDNFEWADGFAPRFGLVEIDREHNLTRKIRLSALSYAEICKNNFIELPKS
jgi:beta-glucosidase